MSTGHEHKKYTVAICGSPDYSVRCAQALQHDSRFQILWTLTPAAQPSGRGQKLTPCALESWAQAQNIPHYAVPNTPDQTGNQRLESLRATLQAAPRPDFLLVVAFGFLLPPWLLELPQIAPINVHPSLLPAYRGASPGQFALLYGENESAVSIMTLDERFDTGAVLAQLPFSVPPTMNQTEYYDVAFHLAEEHLGSALATFVQTKHTTPQPPHSPTPLARRLQRQDGFFPLTSVQAAVHGTPFPPADRSHLSPVLQAVQTQQALTPAQLLDRVVRAFSPWPGAWTLLPEHYGKSDVRLKILAGSLTKQDDVSAYQISRWQIEGEPVSEGSVQEVLS